MSPARAAKAPPSLLPGAATPSPWLVVGVLVLSLLAGLELVAAVAAIRAAAAWSPRLAGTVTVAVGGGGLESAEAAAARATEILARAPGVTRISVLDPDPADAIAARMMGLAGATPAERPPRLLAATLAGDATSPAALDQDLRRENVVAAVDDHGAWTGPIERAAVVAAIASAGSLLVLIILVWALAAASAGGTVKRRADRVGLLLHLGATDGMVLAPFRAGAAGATSLGALIGAAAAAGLAAAAIWSPVVSDRISSELAPLAGLAPSLDAWDLAAVAIWPPVAILVAASAAGGAARARLRVLA